MLLVAVGLSVACCATAPGPIGEIPVIEPVPDPKHGAICYLVRDSRGEPAALSCLPLDDNR